MSIEKTKTIEKDGGLVPVPEGLSDQDTALFLSMPPDVRDEILAAPHSIRGSLIRMRSSTLHDTASRIGREIQEAMTSGGETSPEQLKFAFAPFPTELTRTSPFFPMSKNEMKNREYIKDMIIADNPWGTIKYRGPKLSTYEEDFLLALLAVLNETKHRTTVDLDGEVTYTYQGPLRPLLKAKGTKSPSKASYQQAIEAFKLLAGASFDLTVSKRTARGKKTTSKVLFANLITGGLWDAEQEVLTVTVNPYFYSAFAAGTVTLIDVMVRAQLHSPIAKSLYRFIQSHRENKWHGHCMTLAAAINVDLNLPKNKIRERIKSAIGDLVKLHLLLPVSNIDGDLVYLLRSDRPAAIIDKQRLKIASSPKRGGGSKKSKSSLDT